MCTVTYIPQPGICFLTSNRDESPDRQSHGLISKHQPGHHSIYYPLDQDSGGSWIAMSDLGRAVCLLNGAYKPFVPNPPYRMSRGQVVVDAINADDSKKYIEDYVFDAIAPFTLLIYEQDHFIQLVWDGKEKHISSLSPDQPQIWSSATLYPPHVRVWRKSLFEKWLMETNTFDRESIMKFHQMTNGDHDNDFVMNRHDVVKTLSITNIILQDTSASMVHLALDKDSREEILIQYGK
jgi:hypothetical protein